jgi:hypothetical protein
VLEGHSLKRAVASIRDGTLLYELSRRLFSAWVFYLSPAEGARKTIAHLLYSQAKLCGCSMNPICAEHDVPANSHER